ncbi:MAG: phosphodiester glycosidase family protein [Clostridia bacterium]|nr:phosphodiester glycosidase family protein [Clostridia bacterium]
MRRRDTYCMAMLIALFLCLTPISAPAEWSQEPMAGGDVVMEGSAEGLRYCVERFTEDGARCYLTRIQMEDPGKQIRKATSKWHKNLMFPSDQAKRMDVKATIVINGSGFVCPDYPKIPESWPGKNKSYFYEPLGSLTVNAGEVMRKLDGIPFYGLTLQEDGLHMHVGEDLDEVLAQGVLETWSFYDASPLTLGEESLVDRAWKFSNERECRTVVGRLSDTEYFLLTVTNKTNAGLTLVHVTDWLLSSLRPLWAYNLDGGASSALFVRDEKGTLKTVYGNKVQTVDIMAFCPLE